MLPQLFGKIGPINEILSFPTTQVCETLNVQSLLVPAVWNTEFWLTSWVISPLPLAEHSPCQPPSPRQSHLCSQMSYWVHICLILLVYSSWNFKMGFLETGRKSFFCWLISPDLHHGLRWACPKHQEHRLSHPREGQKPRYQSSYRCIPVPALSGSWTRGLELDIGSSQHSVWIKGVLIATSSSHANHLKCWRIRLQLLSPVPHMRATRSIIFVAEAKFT